MYVGHTFSVVSKLSKSEEEEDFKAAAKLFLSKFQKQNEVCGGNQITFPSEMVIYVSVINLLCICSIHKLFHKSATDNNLTLIIER